MKKYDSLLKTNKRTISWLRNPFKKVRSLYGIKFVTVKRMPKELSDLLTRERKGE